MIGTFMALIIEVSRSDVLNNSIPFANLQQDQTDLLQLMTETSPVQSEIGMPLYVSIVIGIFLSISIFLTIFGNILIILSVVFYRRMRSFTNILLVSLATADLLVGLLVTPLAMLDLIDGEGWQWGWLLCRLWTTVDVLLCSASILNLVAISIDRYVAITSPLLYTSRRNWKWSSGMIAAVWLISLIVCSPPWFVSEWSWDLTVNTTANQTNFECGYSSSTSYRIYSAMGSFYIPLFVMLFVYFKIFRVANNREKMMDPNSPGLVARRSSRTLQVHRGTKMASKEGLRVHIGGASKPITDSENSYCSKAGSRKTSTMTQCDTVSDLNGTRLAKKPLHTRLPSETESLDDSISSDQRKNSLQINTGIHRGSSYIQQMKKLSNIESIDEHSMDEQQVDSKSVSIAGTPASESNKSLPLLAQQAQKMYLDSIPKSLLSTANRAFRNPSGITTPRSRNNKERQLYLKERKALKTIGLVVSGFIICWLPFFVIYLFGSLFPDIPVLNIIFLWLGYSNSVLNPLIYTFYNRDFRRCFLDLLKCGCLKQSMASRSMSVRRLHQSRV